MADKKKTTRKTLRKDEAPYARQLDDAPKSEDGKASGKGAPADKGADKEGGKPAADAKADANGETKPETSAETKPAAEPAPKAAEAAQAAPVEPAPAPAVQASPAAPTDAPIYAELPRVKDIDRSVSPDSAAPPPGIAPPGDSRSFRRAGANGEEFVLIYREHTFLVTRAGTVGKHGAWTIVEYPNQGSAANAYAHKCSDYSGAGYYDLD